MQNSPENTQNLQKAKSILDGGGVVAMPTETVYGLAARIDREDGLRQIFALKERPFYDPLIVHVASIEQAKTVAAKWSAALDTLARAFWPGPLTLVVPKAKSIAGLITAGLDTVGIRLPENETALQLIRLVGVPLAAPSANKFKRTSPTRAEHVSRSFPDLFVLDSGASKVGIESTIVSVSEFSGQTRLQVLRPGVISGNDLVAALEGAGISPIYEENLNSGIAPGSMLEHYQPEKPLLLIEASNENSFRQAAIQAAMETFAANPEAIVFWQLREDPLLAARMLYANLHDFSADPALACLAVWKGPHNSSAVWEAVWDRLGRAAKVKRRA